MALFTVGVNMATNTGTGNVINRNPKFAYDDSTRVLDGSLMDAKQIGHCQRQSRDVNRRARTRAAQKA